jgi:hypothetical protein
VVYSPNKVVAVVKVDGKVLREDKGVVTLPFGSEYSVFVKNLNPTRIKVKVSVDGTDATEGTWLVVDPNSDVDLERFIRNGNMNKGNRFKFIERTAEVEEHRGIGAEDGLIRIEYQVEIVKPKPIVVEEHHHHHHHDHYDYPWYDGRPWRKPPYTLGGLRSQVKSAASRSMAPRGAESDALGETLSFSETAFTSAAMDTALTGSDAGITVPGSESNQKFHWVAGFETGPSEVIVLQLRGQVAGKVATKAVTVDTKLTCITCGKSQKSTEKFCGQCGTALQII